MKLLIQSEKLTKYESIMVALQTIKIIIGAIGVTFVVYSQSIVR